MDSNELDRITRLIKKSSNKHLAEGYRKFHNELLSDPHDVTLITALEVMKNEMTARFLKQYS